MGLKLNLVQDSTYQVLLQDVSDVSAGVSRVILDFKSPVQKRIELTGLTETKAFNFVNPIVNAFLSIKDTDFGQTNGIVPDIYEIDYSVHYPYQVEIVSTLNQNTIWGIQMLTLLRGTEWMYIAGEYYQVIKKYSTEDYLFLDRPITKTASIGEIVYRDKIYLPIVNQLRDNIAEQFRNLVDPKADIGKLQQLETCVFMIIGLIDNIRYSNIDIAKKQMKVLKSILQWNKKAEVYSPT